MSLFYLTPESRKLNELASSNLEEREGDFPWRNQLRRLVKMAMPDPTDPSSYIFPITPVTIVKSAYLKKISNMLTKEGRMPRDFIEAGKKVPQKVLDWLDTVGSLNDLGPPFQRYLKNNPNVRGVIWSKNHPNALKKGRGPALEGLGTVVGFNPKKMDPGTVIHEPGHELFYHLPVAEQQLAQKTYGKMTLNEWNELEQLVKSNLIDEHELFATGYESYLRGSNMRREFKDFPAYIRDLVKKAHERVR